MNKNFNYTLQKFHAGDHDETFYHGTKFNFKIGDLIEAGFTSNYGQGKKAAFVFFTATLDAAICGAELAKGEGRGKVFIVKPCGMYEDDPNLTNKRFEGNPTKSYRTKHPLKITGEVMGWKGHSPEQLQGMKEHLKKLGEMGIEAIDE